MKLLHASLDGVFHPTPLSDSSVLDPGRHPEPIAVVINLWNPTSWDLPRPPIVHGIGLTIMGWGVLTRGFTGSLDLYRDMIYYTVYYHNDYIRSYHIPTSKTSFFLTCLSRVFV